MVESATSAGGGSVPGSLDKPALPQRAGALRVRELIDVYMAQYGGRDTTRSQRLQW